MSGKTDERRHSTDPQSPRIDDFVFSFPEESSSENQSG